MMFGTAVYIFNTYVKPAILEFMERFYLSITMWYVIAKSFVLDQFDEIYKYLLNRLPDHIWGYIWRLNYFRWFPVTVVATTSDMNNKLLFAFNSGIFLLAENFMLNMFYIKQITALSDPASKRMSYTITTNESKSNMENSNADNSNGGSMHRNIISYYYKIGSEQRLLSIDLDRHMYLKDINPSADVAAVRWKTILFNRIPL
jgi:hypothetical protein